MIPVDRDEIRSLFSEIVSLFGGINYILQLHEKSYIPARRDPSFILPGSRFIAGTKFSPVIISSCLGRMKKLINTSLKIFIKVHFNRPKIFLLCFYNAYDVNLWEKIWSIIFVEFRHFTEAAILPRHSAKEVFLKVLQYSQETPVLESLCTASGLQFY